MFLYISIICLLFLLSIFEFRKKKDRLFSTTKGSDSSFILAVLIILILAAIRYCVGEDCESYYDDFLALKDGDLLGLKEYEPGFILVNMALGNVFDNPQCIIIFTSIVIYGLTADYIRKVSPYPILSVFFYLTFYFYFISLNIVRQFMGISVILWGTQFLNTSKKFKWILFILCCLLAYSFHSSCIVGVFYPILYRLKQTSVSKIFILCFAFILYFTVDYFANTLLSIFPQYQFAYSNYGKGGGTDSSVIILFILLFISWAFEKQVKDDNLKRNYSFFQNCIVAGIFLNILGNVNIMFARMGYMFTVNLIILVPVIIFISKKRETILSLSVVLSMAYCIWNLLNNNATVLPYQIFFGQF